MPIKFACPQCKNVMSVADNLAGKNGKCKCGNTVKVPSPASAKTSGPAAATKAADAVSPAMGAMFDQLRESDFERKSPFESLYSPVKSNNDAASLSRFESEDDLIRKKKVATGNLTGMLIFIAILQFLSALSAISAAVVLVVAQDTVEKFGDMVPALQLGMGLGIAFFSVMAVLLIAGGVGLLMKQAWGWFIAAMLYAYTVVDRLITIGMVVAAGFEQIKFFSALIPFVITAALTSYIFKAETQQIFKIRKSALGIVAGILGICLAAGVFGTAYAVSHSASTQFSP